jgi:hypothetical protein
MKGKQELLTNKEEEEKSIPQLNQAEHQLQLRRILKLNWS